MSTAANWLSSLISSSIPGFIQTAIGGVTGSPILVIAATVVLGVGGFFLWGFVKKWMQAGQNVINSTQVQSTNQTVTTENQNINNQVNDIFNKQG